MKKVYLLLSLFAISTYAFSQEKITWGIHAGINVSNISLKGPNNSGVIYNYNYKVGFNGGIDVQLPVSHNITIQPELSFSQMGGKAKSDVEVPGSLVGADRKLNEDYLTLPVLIKYAAPKLRGFAVYIGPQYGYLLSATGSDPSNYNSSASESFTDQYHRSNWSGIVGAEYYCKKGVGVSARYQLGITNDFKEIESVKSHAFTITVGYRF